MAALNFPNNPAGQTPTNTFSPSSTPESSDNGVTYIYNPTNGTWTSESGSSQPEAGAPVIVGTDTPTTREDGSSIQNGDLWWNSTSGLMYLYYIDTDSAQWVASNVTGVPLSSPEYLSSVNNDTAAGEITFRKITTHEAGVNVTGGSVTSNGDIKGLNVYGAVNVKWYGAVGDGTTNDTAAIQAALSSSYKGIYFPPGNYRVVATSSAGGSNLTPLLISAVIDRKIWGNGAAITATSNVYKVFTITGDRTEFSLNCEGNSNIGVFTQFECENPFIHDCVIRNLRVGETTDSKAIAINIQMNNINTGFTVINNVIDDVYAKGDGSYSNGSGMARAINFEANAEITEPILISNNSINLIHGEEGDAISIYNGNHTSTNIVISNNTIKDFNRRGVKVKLSGAWITGNNFQNTWTSAPAPAQGAIDLTDGDDFVVSNNVFTNIEFMNNIKMVEDAVPANNCTIADNVFRGVGSSTGSTLMYFKTGNGANWVIKGNVIDCPGFTGTAIRVQNANKVIISGNCVISNGTDIDTTSGVTNLVSGNNLSITA